ncbi:fumarylacetoacetate hydrolase family protein [Tepidicaulis sp. LMO-SS28]|uniref:fumarylacetoacetate hydrolase family protein n=1 Tax=Tepidicaulis sp. LMO-SS28 TaxID=3447455 RepID=UPI003EDF6A25
MKLVRFGARGEERPGLLDGEGRVRDLSGHVDDIGGAVLSSAGLDRLRSIDPEKLPQAPDGARLGAPVAGTGKILCIGLNYKMHAAETGADVPSEPLLFQKAVSAINGPYDDIVVPRTSTKTDWEVELGVVIGSHAKYVSEEEALSYVAGFCILNDVSERDFQKNRAGQFTKGKSCDTFCPLGPWLVTRDEVADPQDLQLQTLVNGETRQDGSSKDMIHSVAYLVSYLSQFMSLHPGDIIASGTPDGVGAGMKPPQFLKAGDEIVMRVSGLGEQRARLVADV